MGLFSKFKNWMEESDKQLEKVLKDQTEQYLKDKGYHRVHYKIIPVQYKGGIKDLSTEMPNVCMNIFEEAVSFYWGFKEKEECFIPFEDVLSIEIKDERYVKEQVSLGKLLVFGVLAFGMKKNEYEINNEYVIIKTKRTKEYKDVFLVYNSIQHDDFMQLIESYENFKSKNIQVVEKDNIIESNEPKENNVYKDIEQLATLKDKGILTEEEFFEKKKILLDKIK